MIKSDEVLEQFFVIIRILVVSTNEQRYIRIKIDSLLVLRSWKIIGGNKQRIYQKHELQHVLSLKFTPRVKYETREHEILISMYTLILYCSRIEQIITYWPFPLAKHRLETNYYMYW